LQPIFLTNVSCPTLIVAWGGLLVAQVFLSALDRRFVRGKQKLISAELKAALDALEATEATIGTAITDNLTSVQTSIEAIRSRVLPVSQSIDITPELARISLLTQNLANLAASLHTNTITETSAASTINNAPEAPAVVADPVPAVPVVAAEPAPVAATTSVEPPTTTSVPAVPTDQPVVATLADNVPPSDIAPTDQPLDQAA
jgi:hypothetical protein